LYIAIYGEYYPKRNYYHYNVTKKEENKYTLTFLKPKMNDSGLYTVKVVSRTETVAETFNLSVGPYIDDTNQIIIGKAAR